MSNVSDPSVSHLYTMTSYIHGHPQYMYTKEVKYYSKSLALLQMNVKTTLTHVQLNAKIYAYYMYIA